MPTAPSSGCSVRVAQSENWGLTLNRWPRKLRLSQPPSLCVRFKRRKRATQPGGPLDRARRSVQRAFVFTITSPAVLLPVSCSIGSLLQ